MMNIELTTTERNALVNILRRHEHSDGARAVLEKTEPGYSIGDRFRGPKGEYILAQVEPSRVTFIGTESGNRFKEPIHVEDVDSVKPHEIALISGSGEFKKIGEE